MDPKIKRLTKITLLLVLIFVIWSIGGLTKKTFDVQMLWGVGIGFIAIYAFAISMCMRSFGFWRGAGVMGILLAITYGALVLNATRGWPFGFSAFHDVLGWKVAGVSWPVPVLWSALIGLTLVFTHPKKQAHDPRRIFSWAFDTGMVMMFLAFLIQPIAGKTTAMAWSAPGPLLGIPFMELLGWFITGFICAFSGILAASLWKFQGQRMEKEALIFIIAFNLLILMAGLKLDLLPISFAAGILALAVSTWLIWRPRAISAGATVESGARSLSAN